MKGGYSLHRVVNCSKLYRMFLKAAIILVAVFFVVSACPPYEMHASAARDRASMDFPSAVGRVIAGQVRAGAPMVIHIQDFHCNPQTQSNIVAIITHYRKLFPGCRVLVEGAPQGIVDLAPMRTLPDEIRERTLMRMLGAGTLGGGEYAALREEQGRLYGIEDWPTYQRAVESYRSLASARIAVSGELDGLISAAHTIAERDLSGRLRRLNRFIAQPSRDGRWYAELSGLCAAYGVPLYRYPAVATWARIQYLQQKFDEKRLSAQSFAFNSELKKTLPCNEFSVLAHQSSGSQGSLRLLEKHFSALSSFRQRSYPDLGSYFSVTALTRSVDPVALIEQEDALFNVILAAAVRTPAEGDALEFLRLVRVATTALNARLSAKEYAAFAADRDRLITLLSSGDAAAGFPQLLTVFKSGLVEKYYALNVRRDAIFADEVIAALRTQDCGASDVVIVVTGGFHRGIQRVLEDKGVSYVSILPTAGTGDPFPGVYGKLLNDTLLPDDISRSALMPMLSAIGIQQGEASCFIATLTAMAQTFQEHEELTADAMGGLIADWQLRYPLLLDKLSVRFTDDTCVVTAGDRQVVLYFNGGVLVRAETVATSAANPMVSKIKNIVKEKLRQISAPINALQSVVISAVAPRGVLERYIDEQYANPASEMHRKREEFMGLVVHAADTAKEIVIIYDSDMDGMGAAAILYARMRTLLKAREKSENIIRLIPKFHAHPLSIKEIQNLRELASGKGALFITDVALSYQFFESIGPVKGDGIVAVVDHHNPGEMTIERCNQLNVSAFYSHRLIPKEYFPSGYVAVKMMCDLSGSDCTWLGAAGIIGDTFPLCWPALISIIGPIDVFHINKLADVVNKVPRLIPENDTEGRDARNAMVRSLAETDNPARALNLVTGLAYSEHMTLGMLADVIGTNYTKVMNLYHQSFKIGQWGMSRIMPTNYLVGDYELVLGEPTEFDAEYGTHIIIYTQLIVPRNTVTTNFAATFTKVQEKNYGNIGAYNTFRCVAVLKALIYVSGS